MADEVLDRALQGGTLQAGSLQAGSLQAGSLQEVTLRVEGMHCGSCIRRVTQAINQAGPFEVKEVRLGAARFGAPKGTEAAAADLAITALGKAGFPASVDE